MTHIQFVDELVREYLLFRGFGGTLKAFDIDLKLDKDKGFRVDKIVDQLLQHIYGYDLTGLKEAWNHLDTRLFTRLEQHFTPSIRKLENAVLKLYLVNASENNKQDKINEFFNRLTSDLINQMEWKDWFVFPFLKNPEEHTLFGIYFTRQWQDTLIVSLHNFLAAVYQCMPQPTLSSFEENATKIAALQKENDLIRRGLINLINNQEKVLGSEQTFTQCFDGITDDFFTISQEVRANENQAKIFQTILRTLGSVPSSPKVENKEQSVRVSHRKHSVKKIAQTKRSLSIDARPTHLKPRERDSSLDVKTLRTSGDTFHKKDETLTERIQDENFLFLSREEYSEHKCLVTSIRFNCRGTLVASGDAEGNLKIWSVSPTCKTIASFSIKVAILCLDWIPSHERYIICGDADGTVTLYDTVDAKVKWNVKVKGDDSAAKNVEEIALSPVDRIVIILVSGKLFLLNLKSRKVEKCLNISAEATSIRMNYNGQLVMVGTQEGSILMVDLKKNQVVERWSPHAAPVSQLEITSDHSLLYSLARDKIFCKSLNQINSKGFSVNIPEEMKIHPKVHGRLFCLDATGTLILTVGVNSGVIYKVSESHLVKGLELGGHKTMLTCVDWSFANECATCVTASQDGKVKISTLLMNSL